jgi:hypothetical protein
MLKIDIMYLCFCYYDSVTLKKAQKILLITGLVLLVNQPPWYFGVQAFVNKTQTRTTATVIRIESEDARCTGDRPGRPDPTCDRSPREYPVYEYYDKTGKRYEQDDRYFGEYKQNNPIRGLFWKEVDETVTAYYTTGKPEEVLFMASPLAYTAWLIPLYLAIPTIITGSIIATINRYKHV